MEVRTYTAVRQNLAKTMSEVCDNHEPIIVTRANNEAIVMLSLEDYNSMVETNYLLRSSKNAKRILASIEEVEELINIKK